MDKISKSIGGTAFKKWDATSTEEKAEFRKYVKLLQKRASKKTVDINSDISDIEES